MHRSVRDGLEDLLAAKPSAASEGLVTHLPSCDKCSAAVDMMRAQAALFRSLRSPEELEPVAGFYARVLQRIEERTRESIWGVFIYSPFGKRLALASFAIALLLGSYVVAQENRNFPPPEQMMAQDIHYDAPVVGSQEEQREAVLVNFVQHQGTGTIQ